MLVSVGAAPATLTVNVTALLVPPVVVTVTLRAPAAALAAMAKLAVTDVAVEVTPVMVTPVMALIVAPVRFVPASVTATVAPWLPAAGVMGVSVGNPMVKVTALLVPPTVVTVTLRGPRAAAAAMAKLAVTEVAVVVTPVM